ALKADVRPHAFGSHGVVFKLDQLGLLLTQVGQDFVDIRVIHFDKLGLLDADAFVSLDGYFGQDVRFGGEDRDHVRIGRLVRRRRIFLDADLRLSHGYDVFFFQGVYVRHVEGAVQGAGFHALAAYLGQHLGERRLTGTKA